MQVAACFAEMHCSGDLYAKRVLPPDKRASQSYPDVVKNSLNDRTDLFSRVGKVPVSTVPREVPLIREPSAKFIADLINTGGNFDVTCDLEETPEDGYHRNPAGYVFPRRLVVPEANRLKSIGSKDPDLIFRSAQNTMRYNQLITEKFPLMDFLAGENDSRISELVIMTEPYHGTIQKVHRSNEKFDKDKKMIEIRRMEKSVQFNKRHGLLEAPIVCKVEEGSLKSELSKRIQGNINKNILSIVHVHVTDRNGREIFGFIDFSARLHSDKIARYFAEKERKLIPLRSFDLSYYDMSAQHFTYRNSPNFKHMLEWKKGNNISFLCNLDDAVISFDYDTANSRMTVINDSDYYSAVIYDHDVESFNKPHTNMALVRPIASDKIIPSFGHFCRKTSLRAFGGAWNSQ